MDVQEGTASDDLFSVIAEVGTELTVCECNVKIAVDPEDQVGLILDHHPISILALVHRGL
jgi:hypothetical protein